MNMNTESTTTSATTTTTATFEYYSGNWALGCDPTPGRWDGDTFTAADGGKWTVDPEDRFPHPSEDGSGVHRLLALK